MVKELGDGLTEVTLLADWAGHKVGDTVRVDSVRAKTLADVQPKAKKGKPILKGLRVSPAKE